MRWIVLLTTISACDRQAAPPAPVAPGSAITAPIPADASPADPRLVHVPPAVPRGPYVIRYDCFHSDMPFGKGSQARNMSLDLGARQRTDLSIVDDGEVRPQPPPPPTPTVGPIPEAKVAALTAAVDKVLHGGPYLPEYPPSEGTPCTLSIGVGTAAPFFRIDKAFTAERDAVSELIRTF